MASLLDMAVENPLIAQIQEKEGWHPGSVAYRHNNPGNLHFVGQKGAVKGEPAPGGGNYAKFPDYQTGAEALHKQIQLDAGRGLSFRDFAKKYAPDKNADGTPTGNDSEGYAQKLANSVGRNVTEPLKTAFASEEPPTKPTGKSSLLDDAISKQQSEPTGMQWLKSKAEEGAQAIINNTPVALRGAARGLGIPTSMDDVKRMADPPLDVISLLGGPVAGAYEGLYKNTQDAKEQYQRGNKVGGIAQGVAPVAAMLLGKMPEAEGMEGSSFGGPEGPVSPSSAPLPPKGGAPPPPLSPAEANFARTTSKVVQATQPGKLTPKVQEAMKTYGPNIKAQEAKTPNIPLDARTQEGYHQAVKDDLKRQFDSYYQPALRRGTVIDGNEAADARMASIDPINKTDYPSTYQGEKELTDRWRGPMPLEDALNRMQRSYTNVKNFFNANPSDKIAMLQKGATPTQDLATYNNLRKQIYSAIDPENAGENVANIQRQRGDAITMENPFRDMRIKMDQDTPMSSTQRILQGAGGVAGAGVGAWDLLQGRPEGILPAAGGAYAAYKAIKPPTDLNAMVADAFKNYKPQKPTDLTNPNAGAITDPSRLLEAGSTRLGSSQTSAEAPKMNVTTGSPLDQFSPVELSRQEPAPEFAKQRSLLEVQPPTPPARKFPGSALFGPEDDYFFPDWEYPKAGQSGSMETPTTGGAIPNR